MFIKIKDIYNNTHILNKSNIIHIYKCINRDYNSIIEYGTGFIESVYMKETIEELNKKYKFV